MKLPPAQREYLKARIAKSLLWKGHATYVSDENRALARRMAETCLETIEDAATSASTLKEAAHRIVERMEETA